VKMAFSCVGIELDFVGQNIDEKALIKSCSNPNY